MKKFLIALFLLSSSDLYALELDEFTKEHHKKQQQLFASLDYCSNIGSQEIFNLGTQTLDKIKLNLETTKKTFNQFKEQKANCFSNAKDFLDTIIAENLIAMQQVDNSVAVELQNRVDLTLSESLALRKQINTTLIESILTDVDNSLKEAKQRDLINTFITESKKTKELISQELNVIYDSMESQLNLDQHNLDMSVEKNIHKIANVTVRSTFLSLSRALMLFENIDEEPRGYNVAKIKTHLDTAHNKLLELRAYSRDLDKLDSKKEINQIITQLSIITVDVEMTVKDIQDDVFSEDFLDWAGQIYQQTSNQVTKLQQVLDTIYLLETVKEPLPVDITMKEEFLEFDEVADIKPIKDVKPI
tara:strand:+ start:842 stop:1921 length:1080 start_codon:yes stop_codon:yes gene_type:complete